MFSNRNKTQSNEFELVNFFCRVYIKRFFSREGGLLLRNDLIVIRFPFSDFRWVLWCNKLSTVSRWTTPSVCDFARFFDRYVSRRQVDTVETVTINNTRGAERERERERERDFSVARYWNNQRNFKLVTFLIALPFCISRLFNYSRAAFEFAAENLKICYTCRGHRSKVANNFPPY